MPTIKEGSTEIYNNLFRKELLLLKIKKHNLSDRALLEKYDPNPNNRALLHLSSIYFSNILIFQYLKDRGIYSEKTFHDANYGNKNAMSEIIHRHLTESNLKLSIHHRTVNEFIEKVIIPAAIFNADSYFEVFFKKYDPIIKKCPSCDLIFVANRIDATYCHKCKNKCNVQKYRARNHKPVEIKYCKWCQKEFTPKRTTAEYCTDICRVQSGREKKRKL